MSARESDVITKLRQLFATFADARIEFDAMANEYYLRKQAGGFAEWPTGHEDVKAEAIEAGITAMAEGIGGMTTEQKAAVSLAR